MYNIRECVLISFKLLTLRHHHLICFYHELQFIPMVPVAQIPVLEVGEL